MEGTLGDAFARLQGLLRELFQFESKELDFGIYRILNHKRGAIEDFIQNGLAAMWTTPLAAARRLANPRGPRSCGRRRSA